MRESDIAYEPQVRSDKMSGGGNYQYTYVGSWPGRGAIKTRDMCRPTNQRCRIEHMRPKAKDRRCVLVRSMHE